jgi:dienelactone hydrolase
MAARAWRWAIAALAIVTAACSNGVAEKPAAEPGPAPAVRVTTVDLVLDGRHTRADVYQPAVAPRGAAVFAHGFTRTRATMADHARMLAGVGVMAVVPDLPYLADSRDNARALVELVAQIRRGQFAEPAGRIVLIGFSAGALAALLASSSEGVVGFIGLDPFDRPGGVGRAFARTLQIPAVLLRAPPSACNAFSIAAPWATALVRLEKDRVFEAAVHCDFEAPTDGLCRLVCGRPDARRRAAIQGEMLEAVVRWLGPG